MRADGRRTKGLTAIEQAIPHIMPKRKSEAKRS